MEQKNSTENKDSAPAPKFKIGRKVAPVEDNYNNGGIRPKTDPAHNRLQLPEGLMKVSKIKVINRSRPREEEITKCQTKCFFILLGIALIAFGIGLTFYGAEADLRDFLILGPFFLIIGFILIVVGLVLICKDVYILNQAGQAMSDVKQEDDEDFNYYNIKHLNVQEVQANNRRMDLYTVASSRPQTVTSLRSDGVFTTSELLMEPKQAECKTPDPVVPTKDTEETAIRSVPHPTSSSSRTVQNNYIALGGSTRTVSSNSAHGAPPRTAHASEGDGTEIVQETGDLTRKDSTYTVQVRIGDTTEGDTPRTVQPEASYCSPVRTRRPVVVSLEEPMTTDL